jgi:hypothetical protein
MRLNPVPVHWTAEEELGTTAPDEGLEVRSDSDSIALFDVNSNKPG